MASDPKERDAGGKFAKGHKRLPGAGRTKGTPNKVTRAVREFLAALVDDGEAQQAIRDRVIAGDTIAFFRAVDHVLGKPKESLDLGVSPEAAALVQRLQAARRRSPGA